ncbi:MAG: hypothetical protein ACLUD2_12555 [Clostridium sp.]
MDTAHALGKTVTAHVYTNELMQKLIAFGIDGMEHGSLMNRETGAAHRRKGPVPGPDLLSIRGSGSL